MKNLSLLHSSFFLLLVAQICFAQWKDTTDTLPEQINDVVPLRLPHTTHTTGLSPISLHPSFYDRKAEWQWIIDSTWGAGESLTGKLATFNIYQNYARAYNPTFLWNPINWDSLAAALISRINDSTSRGGFAKILNDLTFGLNDGHAYAFDNIILNTPLNPGTPMLADGGGFINHFGAGLTPLADSSLLVYKVVPNHPLGLVPGDIILGYEGVPWAQIVRELIAGGVPHTLFIGGSQSSTNRVLLWAAGESWHMFDTIDVVKYATGITEHLPLDPMVNLVAPSNYINNEQLPVPGVPMPVINPNSGAVKYGIIQGTNIGYIYVYHHGYAAVSSEFDAAVLALMETDGLIIDIRLNWGGRYGLNDGISRLMNHSTFTMDLKKRCSPIDLYSLCPYSASFWDEEIPSDIGTFYDRPIAVLLGPNCLSYGDFSSWQFSYIPNARMFGRSPMSIYSAMWEAVSPQPYREGYALNCQNLTLVDHYEPEIPLWGQEYPLFEEIWLTPDGVANGEDDVVNRAVEWMNNLVYAHNILTDKKYYTPGVDSVHIYTTIENPNSNQISAIAYLKTLAGVLIDSVNLSPLILNLNSEQWFGNIGLPSTEDFYDISVTAFDITNSEQFSIPNATRFTTIGPLVVDHSEIPQTGENVFSLKLYLRNDGSTVMATNVSAVVLTNDTNVTNITGTNFFGNIAPGEVKSQVSFPIAIYTQNDPSSIDFIVHIFSNGNFFWSDSLTVTVPVTGIAENETNLPIEYALKQNYPNPFNPTTTINYSIPKEGLVTLKVYNILGEEVDILLNEIKQVGNYETNFDASSLSSGIYFYRLKAGDFIETKKMILMK